MSENEPAVTVIRFLAEKSAQTQIVIERIFNIERVQPFRLKAAELRGDEKRFIVSACAHQF
jgi:hypothetical protein